MGHNQGLASHYLATVSKMFQAQKQLAERSFAQLSPEEFHWTPEPESNSIAIIIKHLSGNMRSRWRDFLDTDGEKPDRNRDDEFIDDIDTTEELLKCWEEGWGYLFTALAEMEGKDLLFKVKIRGQDHTLIEATQRQLAHYANHVGQIVYIAKQLKSSDWQTLSIARGQSEAFSADIKAKNKV